MRWHDLEGLDAWRVGAWEALADGARRRRSPYHQLHVATTVDNLPSVRIVTLREADAELRFIRFNCDIRSALWTDLQTQPRLALAGYGQQTAGAAPQGTAQIRIAGTANLHCGDDLARRIWADVPLLSRRCYCAEPGPGLDSDAPTSGLSQDLQMREPTLEESQAGFERFGVVFVDVTWMDVYALDFSGHRRATFQWNGNAWDSTWRTP